MVLHSIKAITLRALDTLEQIRAEAADDGEVTMAHIHDVESDLRDIMQHVNKALTNE